MIKALLGFLLLLAIGASAPFLIDDKGYVLISLGQYTYELTVVSLITLIVIFLLIFGLLIWSIKVGFKFGQTAWLKVLFSSKNKAIKNFQKGLAAYLIGDYKRAEQLMSNSAEKCGMANSAWLIAADASSKLKLPAKTENYLQLISQAQEAQKNFSFETLLAAGRLNLAEKQFIKARQILDDNHKLIGHDYRLQCLDVELNIHEERFSQAIDSLKKLRKNKHVVDSQIHDWEFRAFSGYFKQLILKQSISTVSESFQGLSRKEKRSEGIVLAYIDCLNRNGLTDKLEKVTLPLIKKGASVSFINYLKKLPIKHSQHTIDTVQRILVKDSKNVMWLSALAHLCAENNDFDKANKAFHSLFKIKRNKDDLQRYAKLLNDMGQFEQAAKVYQEIY